MAAEAINPTIYAGMKWIIISLSSLVMLVLGKIVWDWLTGSSSRSAEEKYCPMHEHIVGEAKKMELAMTAIRTRYVDRDEHRDSMSNIYAAIGKVGDSMDDIKKDVSDIRVKVAELSPPKKNSL